MYTENKILLCPNCKNTLTVVDKDKCYRCSNGHSFDIARQGYVNLLTSNQKKSKLPGDSNEMVLSRRDFLSKGYYQPVSNGINVLLLEGVKDKQLLVLDIGCGEGYYLNRMIVAAETTGISVNGYGLDISKDAVKHGASSNKTVTWLVASSFNIPMESNGFDRIISVFSPVSGPECARLLKDDGLFVRVLPGLNHLMEIRQIIYPEVLENENPDAAKTIEGLQCIGVQPVNYTIVLDGLDLNTLVKMTPHYWKTRQADKAALDGISRLSVTVDMQLCVFRKDV